MVNNWGADTRPITRSVTMTSFLFSSRPGRPRTPTSLPATCPSCYTEYKPLPGGRLPQMVQISHVHKPPPPSLLLSSVLLPLVLWSVYRVRTRVLLLQGTFYDSSTCTPLKTTPVSSHPSISPILLSTSAKTLMTFTIFPSRHPVTKNTQHKLVALVTDRVSSTSRL